MNFFSEKNPRQSFNRDEDVQKGNNSFIGLGRAIESKERLSIHASTTSSTASTSSADNFQPSSRRPISKPPVDANRRSKSLDDASLCQIRREGSGERGNNGGGGRGERRGEGRGGGDKSDRMASPSSASILASSLKKWRQEEKEEEDEREGRGLSDHKLNHKIDYQKLNHKLDKKCLKSSANSSIFSKSPIPNRRRRALFQGLRREKKSETLSGGNSAGSGSSGGGGGGGDIKGGFYENYSQSMKSKNFQSKSNNGGGGSSGTAKTKLAQSSLDARLYSHWRLQSSEEQSKMTKNRVNIVDDHFGHLCQAFGTISRAAGKSRDAGDGLARALLDFARAETLNSSASEVMKQLAVDLAAIEDHREMLIGRLATLVMKPLQIYGDVCRIAKEDLHDHVLILQREKAKYQHLHLIRDKNPLNKPLISEAREELRQATLNTREVEKLMADELVDFERRKLEDLSLTLKDFFGSSLAFHAKSIELLTKATNDLKLLDVDNDVEEVEQLVFMPRGDAAEGGGGGGGGGGEREGRRVEGEIWERRGGKNEESVREGGRRDDRRMSDDGRRRLSHSAPLLAMGGKTSTFKEKTNCYFSNGSVVGGAEDNGGGGGEKEKRSKSVSWVTLRRRKGEEEEEEEVDSADTMSTLK